MTTARCYRCHQSYAEMPKPPRAAALLICGLCKPRYPEIDWAAVAKANYHARTIVLKEPTP